MDDRRLYTTAEAAKLLSICEKTLRLHVKRGELIPVVLGKRTRRFAHKDLEAFINSNRIVPVPCPSPASTQNSSGKKSRRSQQRVSAIEQALGVRLS